MKSNRSEIRACEDMVYMLQRSRRRRACPILKNSKKTKKYLDSLSRIYLVVRYAGIAILEFPFAEEYTLAGEREKNHCNVVPLVYDHEDCNGACDNYVLRKITDTTTGWIIDWCYTREEAEELRTEKEKEYEG